jgi:hypothetical protein
LERFGQFRRRRRHGHRDDAGPVAGRKHHTAFARAQRTDDGQNLVVVGELAHANHCLIGLAGGVESNDAQLLAADAAGGVDLVDRHLCRDLIRLRKCRKRACP